ncbi:hypothetical protein ACNF49_38350 [Actinomadura sp. ATCC 39365]
MRKSEDCGGTVAIGAPQMKPAPTAPPPRRRLDWGPWKLDRSKYVLYYQELGWRHEVDLQSCTTSAALCDWIFRHTDRTYADHATIAGLINALDDILHPAATLRSESRALRLTKAHIRALVHEHAAAGE